jgi:hypothetical protein
MEKIIICNGNSICFWSCINLSPNASCCWARKREWKIKSHDIRCCMSHFYGLCLQKTSYDANMDVPSVDPSAAISERPSPVSVLDSSFDQEDLFPTSRTPNSLAVGMITFLQSLHTSFVNHSNWKLKYVSLFHFFNVSIYLLSILVADCTVLATFEPKVPCVLHFVHPKCLY